jgi:hypothetical protein
MLLPVGLTTRYHAIQAQLNVILVMLRAIQHSN